MAITPRLFAERGRRRAASLGIDPELLPPGQSPTVKWPVLSLGPAPRLDRGCEYMPATAVNLLGAATAASTQK